MNTKKSLNQETLYQIFPRNYSKQGTFKAIQEDLPRIKDLGIDIIYLTPIHQIGEKNRKGTWGSPYAIKDYFSITPDYGTLDDFKELINKVHEMDMKIIIDMVFNHTSPDNVLLKDHEDYYYHKNGKLANRVGDWSDIVDLETSKKEVQDYLISVLSYWKEVGVDGFRFDVASIIPLELFTRAREVLGTTPIFFAESVEPGFIEYNKSLGFPSIEEPDLYPTFDSSYSYNTNYLIYDYLSGKTNSIKEYVEALNKQEQILPKGFNKSTSLSNHDQDRLAARVKDELSLKNLIAFTILNKGLAFIYAGEEYKDAHKPELFEKDPINKEIRDQNYYDFIKKLIAIKKLPAFQDYKNISYHALSDDIIEMSFDKHVGIFNLSGKPQSIILQEGKYHDLISDSIIDVKNHILQVSEPLMLEVKKTFISDSKNHD